MRSSKSIVPPRSAGLVTVTTRARGGRERAEQPACQGEVPEVVRGELPLEAVDRPCVGDEPDTGIVYQHVEPIVSSREIVGEALHGFRVPQVEWQDHRAPPVSIRASRSRASSPAAVFRQARIVWAHSRAHSRAVPKGDYIP